MAENKKLDNILKELEENFNIKKASDITKDEVIRTGLYPLDYVLGGGIKISEGGNRIEFYGAESTCKTAFALKVIKKFQEEDLLCAFLNGEGNFDKEWASILGVNIDKLLYGKPESLEDLGEILVKLIAKVDLIVVDSITSFIPEEEDKRDINEPTMGLQARINALLTRKAYKALINRKTVLIFINQIREKLTTYGNPITVGGGHALKHFFNTKIFFKTGEPIDVGTGDKKDRIGFEINMKATKNKMGIPYKNAVIDFYFNGTLDNKKSLFFSAVKFGIIKRSGAWFEYEKIREQGQEKLTNALKDEDWKKIEEEIWKRIK